MDFILDEWKRGFTPEALTEIAGLWNANAAGRHAFYAWTGTLLERMLVANGRCLGRILSARTNSGELAGWTHVTLLAEEGYPRAGVVEMLLVDRRFRRCGLGGALLEAGISLLERQTPKPEFIDALGAWPYGCAYNALADGSERSGVFLSEAGLYRLFRCAGFEPVRKSLVMRASLADLAVRPPPRGGEFHITPRREKTWLDRTFRGRELWDFNMTLADGNPLSRAIFGFMEGESRQEGKAIFSLFGVNTPIDLRNRGYAGINISHLMAHVAGLGGEVMELHAYADNAPALALYRGLGFREAAETMMLHRPGRRRPD
ncbi:MAG: hypothetical protein FWG74_07215 [Planctomycetes bacterium]|nr:hypothetical protein [Planctomycetota bacterium]